MATSVLVAEDEPISRSMLLAQLHSAGYRVVAAENGERAWEILQSSDAPSIAIIDWMMPGLDGLEICRRLRGGGPRRYVYVILLTARACAADVVTGLEAGADDYVTKPFDWNELHGRLRTGTRIQNLQGELAAKLDDLKTALAHVKTLQGLLPICMHCKRIRDDANTWHRLESYIEEHSNALFTHSLCRKCLETHYPDYVDAGPVG
jgi:DNA-binding response OmpR family regulator